MHDGGIEGPVRAFVIRGPGEAGVEEVAPPIAGPGQVVLAVDRVGICGTDLECFSGTMAYLVSGRAGFPLRPGHEWCGTVVETGDGVDGAWMGRRATGDTMLSCGRCRRCRQGHWHVCETVAELGLQGGWAGALAERIVVTADSLHPLPDAVDDAAGALVEPGANAFRAAEATGAGPGERVLVLGAGTIGLLTARFLSAAGAETHVAARSERSLGFARSMGLPEGTVWPTDALPDLPWDAVVDATNDRAAPARALDLVEPAGRVVGIGLAGEPSPIDSRTLAFKDVTWIGILGGSAALDRTIDAYAAGTVDPRPLISATITLEETAAAMAALVKGGRPAGAGPGPKLHIDPRRGPH